MNDFATISVPVDLIDIPEGRSRRPRQDSVIVLAENIKVCGLLQPIGVRPNGGRYDLVFGAHRLYAFRYLGRETISAVTRDDGDDLITLDFAENAFRLALTPLQKGRALYKLKADFEAQNPKNNKGDQHALSAYFEDESQVETRSKDVESQVETHAPVTETKSNYVELARDQYGLSRPAIFRLIKLAKNISPALEVMMKGHPIETNNSQLMALANLIEDNRQPVLQLIIKGKAKTVADAADMHLNIKKPAPQIVKYSRARQAFRKLKVQQKRMFLSEVLHDFRDQEFNGYKIVKVSDDG